MKLTVTTLSGELYMLDVGAEMELEGLKALCEFESGVPAREMVLMHEGRPLLDEKRSLKSHAIKEGDVLLIQHLVPPTNASTSSGAGPPLTTLDFSRIPVPAGGQSSDLFTRVLREQQKEKSDRDRQRIRMMNADPFDPETQRLIAEEIRQQNIDSNMEAAMEYHPESFGQVVMLYINCRVNGHPVKAFIDSGAQTTIMSQACAERCAIMRLVDPRWAGVAKGVGTQRIIGRIHLVQIEIEGVFLTSSFSVLEEQPMDMLLGLDMLKRHQCLIDLKRNVLVMGTTGTETPFLGEGELPECARLQMLGASQSGSTLGSEASSRAGEEFPADTIDRLVAMGFERAKVVAALRQASGNSDQALAALLAQSLQGP
ncbi:DNA damage inducible 1 homolog rngo isoform X3 [Rhipicephalus microplus]|uniref:DNA damage inducible 1 homolog rngo isoform X3 n=1 Tax=Rhipicephalus microplus TaxID=6941 RepID=UPI00188949B9|nr:protein DDI1 homolog 2-like isoform X3 [Rhipicephalus microplus]